jgi:predicted ArsR family transcriptional regulator
MTDPCADGKLPRSITRKLEQHEEFPLSALEAVTEARTRLDEIECDAIGSARERGATLEDIAEALGLSRQAVHYKLQNLAARRAKRAHTPA